MRALGLCLGLMACTPSEPPRRSAPDASVPSPSPTPTPTARSLPAVKARLSARGGEPRTLAPGEHVTLAAKEAQDLDVGLAARVHVEGPALLASDPDGERRAFLLGGRAHVSVSADSAASPFGLELATLCGVLHVARSAEFDADLRGAEECAFTLSAGSASLATPGSAIPHVLVVGQALRCASASACVVVPPESLPKKREAALPAPGEPTPYRRWLGEELTRSAAEVARLRGAERVALANDKAKERSREALALQRQLALGAAEALRARARLRTLLNTYRAGSLAQTADFAADSREREAVAALRRDP